MKILHFADVHIGMENYSQIDHKTGLATRFLDFLNSLDQIVTAVEKQKPDLIIFAGDAYKDRNPSPTHQREFAARIKQMANVAPTILVVGNHDLPQAMEKANTLDIFSALKVDNVIVSHQPEILNLKTKSGPIQILTLPWITKSQLLEKDQFSGKSIKDIQKLLSAKINQIVKDLISQLSPDIPAIAVAHISSESATYGSERSVMLGQDLTLSEKIFKNSKIKYVALGHIHKYQVLSENPPIIYPGSIDRIDFGEEHDAKGYVLVELDGRTKFEFIPIKTRPFITLNLDLRNAADYEKEIKKQIAKEKITGAVVRARVKLANDLENRLTDADIRRHLTLAHFVASISFDTPERRKISEVKYFEPLSSPIDTLDEYLKFKKFPKNRRQKLKEYAEKIIADLE